MSDDAWYQKLPRNHLFSGVDLFQQPSHVLPEDFHGANALLVFLDIARLPADADVPIRRARHDHFVDQEKVIQGVKSMHGARPAHRDYAGTDLMAKHAAVRSGNQTGPV